MRKYGLTTALAVLLSGAAFGETVQKPTPGTTGTLPTPVIVNLYWDTSHDVWNADSGADGATIERIDALTKALVNSGYFEGLWEYGIVSWKFGKSIVLGEVCPSLGTPPADTGVGHSMAGQVLNCIQPALAGIDPNNLLLNYFYPPQVVPGSDFGATTNAYHDHAGGVADTWIPLIKGQALRRVSEFLTHEMVEAITDIDANSGAGYHDYDFPFIGSEIADLCGGGSNGPSGETKFSSFLQDLFSPTDTIGMISNYWSNSQQGCFPGMVAGPTAPTPDTQPNQSSISLCGRGKNMSIFLSFTENADISWPHLLPWDLGPVSIAPDGNGGESGSVSGHKTMYLNASVTSPNSNPNPNQWKAGGFLRVPTPDTIGFGNVGYQYFCGTSDGTCFTNITISGFDQDVSMAAGDVIVVDTTDPYSGLSTTRSIAAPHASFAQLWVTPPSGAAWTTFGDASQIHGQMQGQCGSGGPVEGEPASGATAAYLENYDPYLPTTPFSAGVSDAQGMFQAPLVTDTAGKQTVNLLSPPTTINVDVHPSVTGMLPAGGYVSGNQHVVITGAGFALPDQAPRTTVMVGTTPASNVLVASDGKSVSFTTPAGVGTEQVIVYVDGVPSAAQGYLFCTPTTSCSQSMACNKTISDGCGGTIACGACGSGSACTAGSCCPSGFEADGTGGCVCAPHHGCRVGTSFDPTSCSCSGDRF